MPWYDAAAARVLPRSSRTMNRSMVLVQLTAAGWPSGARNRFSGEVDGETETTENKATAETEEVGEIVEGFKADELPLDNKDGADADKK